LLQRILLKKARTATQFGAPGRFLNLEQQSQKGPEQEQLGRKGLDMEMHHLARPAATDGQGQ